MTKSALKTLLCSVGLLITPWLFAQTESLSKALNTQVSVSGQMTTAKFRDLLQDGFKSVIVNRPDQETGNLVSINQLLNITEQAQVTIIYQLITSVQVSEKDTIEFAKLL